MTRVTLSFNAGNSAEQYQRLFPEAKINVFYGRVVMPTRTNITQIPVGPYTLQKTPQLLEQITQAFQDRQKQYPHESPSVWGLVANAAIRSQLEEKFPGINARHYGNQTGSNELENVRFLIVAGDFKPNPHGFLEEAQAIWGDSSRLHTTSRITHLQNQDQTGKSLKNGRRGYLDPRLDARWLELTGGEVRQAVGRGRPWNTSNHQPDQGLFFEELPEERHLDILLLSSYALEAITPNQLTGQRADLEDVLTKAALELRRAGQLVTLKALHGKTGISDRQIRERFNRVKLRSEAEWFTLKAILQLTPPLAAAGLVTPGTTDPQPTQHLQNGTSRRGPPLPAYL